MTSLLPHRRHRRAIDEQMVALINIVFLLLIFFMCAGQIQQSHDDSVRPPGSSSLQPVNGDAVTLSVDRSGTVALNGEVLNPAQLERGLRALLTASGKATIAVKADRELRARDLDPLLHRLHKMGVAHLTLYTVKAELP